MVIFCLLYVLETRDVLHAYQSGFRKGRSTIDAVICLENEIKESSSEKKMVLGVFFDIEKVYDMVWKEVMLMQLNQMGIMGSCLIGL